MWRSINVARLVVPKSRVEYRGTSRPFLSISVNFVDAFQWSSLLLYVIQGIITRLNDIALDRQGASVSRYHVLYLLGDEGIVEEVERKTNGFLIAMVECCAHAAPTKRTILSEAWPAPCEEWKMYNGRSR